MPAYETGKPRVVLNVRGVGSYVWDPIRQEVRFLPSHLTLRSLGSAEVVTVLSGTRNYFVGAARAAARDVMTRLPAGSTGPREG